MRRVQNVGSEGILFRIRQSSHMVLERFLQKLRLAITIGVQCCAALSFALFIYYQMIYRHFPEGMVTLPVRLTFTTSRTSDRDSFLRGNLSLLRRHDLGHIPKARVPYRVSVFLEVPESQTNLDVIMITVISPSFARWRTVKSERNFYSVYYCSISETKRHLL